MGLEKWVAEARAAGHMVSVYDADGICLTTAGNAAEHLGYRPEDIEGKAAYRFIHPDDVPRVSAVHVSMLEDGRARILDYRIRTADGKYVEVTSEARAAVDSETKRPIIVLVTRLA